MSYRRRVRSTYDLVSWCFARLGGRAASFELVDAIVRELLEVGRRRGRAELAAEVHARLGLDVELGAAPPHEMRVLPSLSVDAVPTFAAPETAGPVRQGAIRTRRSRFTK